MIYLELFFCFFKIGLFSFGGGYAAMSLIQNQVVLGHHWLEMSEFADLITIAEMTPGPIAVNAATFVGQRLAGLPGALICTLGCITPSLIIVLLLSWLYCRYSNLDTVQGVLVGLRPAVIAMIASAGLTLLLLALFGSSDWHTLPLSDFRGIECVLFVLCLFLLRRYKVSPILIIFGSGLAGTLVYLAAGLL